jgi:hypothetical protein
MVALALPVYGGWLVGASSAVVDTLTGVVDTLQKAPGALDNGAQKDGSKVAAAHTLRPISSARNHGGAGR